MFIQTNNLGLSDDIELDYLEVDTVDIDDDGIDEYIYSVGLIDYEDLGNDDEVIEDTEEETNQKYVSFVYTKKDDRYILIDKIDTEGDPVSYVRLSFAKLIDFNNDNNYEFVIEKMMSEYGPYHYELYNLNNYSFTKIGGE